MLGMVIHLQIREKHVENPASHRLSLEMPVAYVFGVTLHLQCYSIQDVLSIASAMVIPLYLSNCLGNPLTWRCCLLKVQKYWGGFVVGKPPCGIAVTAVGLAGPWNWQKEVEGTRTWWTSIALPALPSTQHLQSLVRYLPQLPRMCTSQVRLSNYAADLSNN